MKRIFFLLLVVFMTMGLSSQAVLAEGKEKELKNEINVKPDFWASLERVVSDLVLIKMGREFPSPESSFQAAGLSGMVPYRSPAPAFSRNLLVTKDLGTPLQTEPHVAVNPKDPNHAVLSAIEYALPYNSAYITLDGGQTWEGPRQITTHRETLWAGDPTVAFNRNGKVFSAFMGIGEEKTYAVANLMVDIPTSNISVASSEDMGFNWQEAVMAFESGFYFELNEKETKETGQVRGVFAFNFLDKPWMAIGSDSADPSRDIIYVTYTEFAQWYNVLYAGEAPYYNFIRMQTSIKLVKSDDDGRTWSEPVDITPYVDSFERKEALQQLSFRVVQGSQPAVTPDGTVFVAWYDSLEDGSGEGKGRIYARSSRNGSDFGEPVLAAEFYEGNDRPRSASFRNPSYFPQIAAGPGAELYIVFAARTLSKPTDDGDIYFVRSLDMGQTFSRLSKINQDKTNRLQFFPAIAVTRKGNLNVMWGDMRDDPAGLKYHIYYTQSLDRGDKWGFDLPEKNIREPDTRVTDFPSNPNKAFPRGAFIGDYFAIAANDQDVYLVWTDARLGEYGGTNQKIGFARRRAMPSPEVFFNPARGPGGQEVTVQAHNFQPDMNLFIKIGGSIVSAGRSGQDGTLTYRLFMPIASQGAQDVMVFDDSGNAAVSSFFIDFGFGDLAFKPAGKSNLLALALAASALIGIALFFLSLYKSMRRRNEK